MKTINQQTVSNVWEKTWQQENQEVFEDFDDGSQEILRVIKLFISSFQEKQILEVGSGTGKISLRMAKDGGQVTLLDTAPTALEKSKQLFEKCSQKAEYILGSGFDLPFADNSFDLVWNGGVFEHFKKHEQKALLAEMARVCRSNGLIITFNPYKLAFFYRLGKFLMEITGRWPHGYEKPMLTMKKLYEPQVLVLQKEFSNDFTSSLEHLFPGVLKKAAKQIFLKLLKADKHPRFFTRLFGGYLLVSVFRKK